MAFGALWFAKFFLFHRLFHVDEQPAMIEADAT
jgi:hypothetical protein